MTFTFLTIFGPNNFSFILGFSFKKQLNYSSQLALVLTIWIHLPSNFQCFRRGHVCVCSRHCQDDGVGVADELKDELSYLKFNVLGLITNRHLEKKSIWNCSKLCLYACMRQGVQEPRTQNKNKNLYRKGKNINLLHQQKASETQILPQKSNMSNLYNTTSP